MANFFSSLKHLPDMYYNWRKLDEGLEKLLENSDETQNQLQNIQSSLDAVEDNVAETQARVKGLEDQVNHINGRLEVIGRGTKMELFDTLYHWKKILVDDRKWASAAEKHEVKEIYEVYHDGLKGNGQGEVYFREIMALPEEPPRLNN